MDTEALGPTVRRLRLAADLTLERLSELSGVSDRALSDIERGAARGPRSMSLRARSLTPESSESRSRVRSAASRSRRTVGPSGSVSMLTSQSSVRPGPRHPFRPPGGAWCDTLGPVPGAAAR